VKTRRLTMARRSRTSSTEQYVERTDARTAFCRRRLGNLWHGNIAGVGQALQQQPAFRYYLARNEQAMVHISTAFARMNNRMRRLCCTSSDWAGGYEHESPVADMPRSTGFQAVTPGRYFLRGGTSPLCSSNSSPNTPGRLDQRCFQARLPLLGSDQSARSTSIFR